MCCICRVTKSLIEAVNVTPQDLPGLFSTVSGCLDRRSNHCPLDWTAHMFVLYTTYLYTVQWFFCLLFLLLKFWNFEVLLLTSHLIMNILQSTLYELHTRHFILFTSLFTLHTVHCALHTARCKLHTAQHTLHCVLLSIQLPNNSW